jgi:hypothetical protein
VYLKKIAGKLQLATERAITKKRRANESEYNLPKK